MLTSADELLKTRTIPELRRLVFSLSADADGKQTELRSMVGSKYHDFIQSADAISDMKTRAHVISQRLTKNDSTGDVKIGGLEKLSLELVEKTSALLNLKAQVELQATAPTTIRQSSELLQQFEEPSSARVWAHLEECSAYEAARVVAVASLILHVSRPIFDPLEANKELTAMKYIDADLLMTVHRLMSAPVEGAASYVDLLLQGSLTAVFLRQTILDDVELILLEGSCGVLEKAKTLACLGALSSKSLTELMQIFLDSAELQLDEALDELASAGKGKLSFALVSEKLFLTINILQSTLLDAYHIFFKPTTSAILPPVGEFDGLLSRVQTEFIADLSIAMKLLLRSVNSQSGATSSIVDSSIAVDTVAFMKDLQARASKSQIRSIFDTWLGRIVASISLRCKVALGSMESAFEVAKLQQKVWSGCCTLLPKPIQFQQKMQYTQSDWVEACEELLSQRLAGSKHLRQKDSMSKISSKDSTDSTDGSSIASHSTHLWSAVFRGPFMVQVERLLQQSCHAVMLRTKQQIVDALALEGLLIDPLTFQISVSTSQGKSSKSFSVNNSADLNALGDDWAPSPRIFRRAEYVRSLLEDEITEMFGEMLSPVHTGDAFSTVAFSRAMFVQCSQFAGHLVLLLRCLAKSFKDQLERRLRLFSPLSNPTELAELGPLFSGLLIVGRLSWLLKIRGRFIEEALVNSPSKGHTSSLPFSSYESNSSELSTEEQMRSAFEIADTDGDGIVTNAEAIEAIQALSTGDIMDPKSPPTHLSSTIAPNLSFNEFVLICNNIIQEEESRPLDRFRVCIDSIVSSTHDSWASILTETLRRRLDLSMRLELLGLDSVFDGTLKLDSSTLLGKAFEASTTMSSDEKKRLCQKLFTSSSRGLRSSWVLETNDLETVSVPSNISHSLSEFLFSLSKLGSGSLLSVDTIQEVPLYGIFDATITSAAHGQRLADRGFNSIFSQAVTVLSNHFEGLKRDVLEVAAAQKARVRSNRGVLSKSANSKPSDTSTAEDIALQVVLDLQVCNGIFGRFESDSRSVSAAVRNMKKLLDEWQDVIDPVNAQTVSPILEAKAKVCLSKAVLLFPGQRDTVNPQISSSSGNSDASSGIENVFLGTISSRFSLLPLAMTSVTKGKGGSLGSAGSTTDTDEGQSSAEVDSIGSTLQKGIASAASSTSMSAAKSFIGDLGNRFGKLGLGL